MKPSTPPRLPDSDLPPNARGGYYSEPAYTKFIRPVGGVILFVAALAIKISVWNPLEEARRNDPVVVFGRKGIFLAGLLTGIGLLAVIYGPDLIEYLRDFREQPWNTKKFMVFVVVLAPAVILLGFFEWQLRRLGYIH